MTKKIIHALGFLWFFTGGLLVFFTIYLAMEISFFLLKLKKYLVG